MSTRFFGGPKPDLSGIRTSRVSGATQYVASIAHIQTPEQHAARLAHVDALVDNADRVRITRMDSAGAVAHIAFPDT